MYPEVGRPELETGGTGVLTPKCLGLGAGGTLNPRPRHGRFRIGRGNSRATHRRWRSRTPQRRARSVYVNRLTRSSYGNRLTRSSYGIRRLRCIKRHRTSRGLRCIRWLADPVLQCLCAFANTNFESERNVFNVKIRKQRIGPIPRKPRRFNDNEACSHGLPQRNQDIRKPFLRVQNSNTESLIQIPKSLAPCRSPTAVSISTTPSLSRSNKLGNTTLEIEIQTSQQCDESPLMREGVLRHQLRRGRVASR